MIITKIMRLVGWVGTLGAGALAAKGMGEFLPASKEIVWSVGGTLEVMNIVSLAWLSSSHRGKPVIKFLLGTLCAIVVTLDIAGVAGQFARGYQGAVNEQRSIVQTEQTTVDAEISAAQATVDSIDRQFAALDSQEQAASQGLTKARGDRQQIKAIEKARNDAKADRDRLNEKREAAVTKVASLKGKKGAVEGRAINASSEFAAAQYVGKMFGISADEVAYYSIAVLASLLPLFSVFMMLGAGHVGTPEPEPTSEPEIRQPQPVKVDALVVKKEDLPSPAPLPFAVESTMENDPDLSQEEVAEKSAPHVKGWETRKARKRLAKKGFKPKLVN